LCDCAIWDRWAEQRERVGVVPKLDVGSVWAGDCSDRASLLYADIYARGPDFGFECGLFDELGGESFSGGFRSDLVCHRRGSHHASRYRWDAGRVNFDAAVGQCVGDDRRAACRRLVCRWIAGFGRRVVASRREDSGGGAVRECASYDADWHGDDAFGRDDRGSVGGVMGPYQRVGALETPVMEGSGHSSLAIRQQNSPKSFRSSRGRGFVLAEFRGIEVDRESRVQLEIASVSSTLLLSCGGLRFERTDVLITAVEELLQFPGRGKQ
jgi:hypothetical protein